MLIARGVNYGRMRSNSTTPLRCQDAQSQLWLLFGQRAKICV